MSNGNGTDQTTSQTKRFLQDLFVDDVSQKMHIARAATALGYGLDPCNYTRPFPGTNTTVNVQQERRTLPWWAGIGLGLSILSGGALAGILGAGLANVDRQVQAKPAEPTTSTPAPVKYRVTFTTEEGDPIRIEEKK